MGVEHFVHTSRLSCRGCFELHKSSLLQSSRADGSYKVAYPRKSPQPVLSQQVDTVQYHNLSKRLCAYAKSWRVGRVSGLTMFHPFCREWEKHGIQGSVKHYVWEVLKHHPDGLAVSGILKQLDSDSQEHKVSCIIPVS